MINSDIIAKLLLLVETIENSLPDPPRVAFIPRTAITKKQDPDTINLNRSKTSQQARTIEDQLAADLEKQYQKIINDPFKDFPVLQKKYGPETEQLIRTAVQQLYLIGAAYATNTQNTTAFITTKDLDNIKKQVEQSTAAFWRRIYTAIYKKDFMIMPTSTTMRTAQAKAVVGTPTVDPILDLEEEEPRESNPAADATAIATMIATMTLALSTLTKLDQLDTDGEGEKIKVVWISEQDAKVCPICQGLHGQEWETDDSTIPMPVDDTHLNCRCRILIKQGDDILLG